MLARAAAVALVALAVSASPALAAAPTLTGQRVDSDVLLFGGPSTLDCQDNPDGTVDLSYRFAGSSDATGPYPGDWFEEGRAHLSAIDDPIAGVNRKILSFASTFTFDSPAGQVHGTKRLAPSTSNDAGVDCDTGVFGYVNPKVTYNATIINADGIFTDRGSGTVSFGQNQAGQPVFRYLATFTSDLSATEQNESALFGTRVPGGSFSAMSTNTKRASPFVLWFPATVRKVYAYIDGGGATSGSQVIRAVLYRRDPATGGPGAYVTRSFEYTVAARTPGHWQPLWLAPIPRLDPGVYWVGIQSGPTNGVARFAWSSKPDSRRYNVDVFADGASDPFGAGFGDDQQMSVLAAGSY